MFKLFAIMLALSFAGNTQASLVTLYDPLSGTVSFTFDSDLTGLFGTPEVSGNSLTFQPTEFSATASNGPNVVSDSVSIKIQALDPQNVINTIAFSENGFYTSFGDATLVASGQILAANGSSNTSDTLVAGPFATQDFSSAQWSANTLLDTSAWNSNFVTVSLSNVLFAASNSASGFAFIEKSLATLNVTAVPLPATIWLLGAALIGLISSSKRNGRLQA